MEKIKYWIGWQLLLPGAAKRFWHLMRRFGSTEAAWNAGENVLVEAGGFSPEAAAEICRKRRLLDIDNIRARLANEGIEYVYFHDHRYPEPLKTIYDPPPGLFIRGRLAKGDEPAVALVGSRRATHYGLAVARKLAADLAAAGVTVVSGMARGIDTSAHRGALEQGGRTLAVLGCGVDVVYPRENAGLMQDIMNNGAVISEFPPGTQPQPWHFPVRNRIISGLCRSVTVVEAAEKSGALITADVALEQGRDVLAVPGSIASPMSRGSNKLIKQGARLVEDASDILDELGIGTMGINSLFPEIKEGGGRKPRIQGEQGQVLGALSLEPVDLDYLVESTGLSPQQVLSALMFLELKGLVRQVSGMRYVISKI